MSKKSSLLESCNFTKYNYLNNLLKLECYQGKGHLTSNQWFLIGWKNLFSWGRTNQRAISGNRSAPCSVIGCTRRLDGWSKSASNWKRVTHLSIWVVFALSAMSTGVPEHVWTEHTTVWSATYKLTQFLLLVETNSIFCTFVSWK